MDYAGYGDVRTVRRVRSAPEPSIFAKIPALDGMGEDFGTEYTFSDDMVLPEMDLSPGAVPVEQQPGWGTPRPGMGVLGVAALGVGLWLLFR
jgi:hypothetical protein